MRTLLLVDDYALLRDAVREMLTLSGVAVTDVGNSVSAIEAYQAEPTDVVLIDVQMPDMDGLSLCTRLRRIARQHGHPFCAVLMTGCSTPELEYAAKAAGSAGVITKPFTIQQLVEALNRAAAGWLPSGHAA